MLPEESLEEWCEREQLHFASAEGDLGKVKRLVAEGFPLDAFDDLSRTPLHCAVEGGHLEVVKYLLSAGAEVNAREERKIGNSPLGAVAGNCSYEMADLLVKAGADPILPGWMNLSALDHAGARKKEEGIELLRLIGFPIKI